MDLKQGEKKKKQSSSESLNNALFSEMIHSAIWAWGWGEITEGLENGCHEMICLGYSHSKRYLCNLLKTWL